MKDLHSRSIELIAAAQDRSGAIVAAPTFSVYGYCWFRDSSFIAHAMDCAGRSEVSGRYFAWGRMVIERYAPKVERGLAERAAGRPVRGADMLHCRYRLDGSEGSEHWGNFQMDGFGSYLWALAHHLRSTRADVGPYLPTIELLVRYVSAFWDLPQFDCWEESEDRYPATIACLYGGLRAVMPWLSETEAAAARSAQGAMRQLVSARGLVDGRLAKRIDGRGLDASLLWCAVPFGLFEPTDPVVVATVEAIERDLLNDGVHRFPEDTYYGGGAWPLLTAWLGWYYTRVGRLSEARALLDGIAKEADATGALPEQTQTALLTPTFYEVWLGRWGPPARPLIWSHAMYLILADALAGHTTRTSTPTIARV